MLAQLTIAGVMIKAREGLLLFARFRELTVATHADLRNNDCAGLSVEGAYTLSGFSRVGDFCQEKNLAW